MEAKLFKSSILRINNSLRPYPSLFYFPGLQSNPFWSKDTFNTVNYLEKNYEIIKEEYIKAEENTEILLENDYKFSDHEKSLHKGDWEWYSYISKGSKTTSFPKHFPKTSAILDKIPDIVMNLPFSYCFFSKLSPGSHISPHYGPCNIRLRVHLGLDIPEGCFIKVAETEKKWENGKCLVFDDTYLHEVKNENTNKKRTILLLDIWHPDIKLEERQAIEDMFKVAYDKGWLKSNI